MDVIISLQRMISINLKHKKAFKEEFQVGEKVENIVLVYMPQPEEKYFNLVFSEWVILSEQN